ncbi:MAG: flagellar biosynthesis protein FlgD [Candidatus Dactylopiibacterium carminicum]|uniref:Basal-body rod modification protein FlgD n=1 Tax=Candidatus Dactylopiibacterium carminicum TaxID=857335 RepID=A0A272EU18_9RHOO|nr:flagellar hook assembly protein FlgD [Candidatus Dactylopiibacterium carminicum]KAF7599635.1 flagellar biosynthesis protein FlgD [Candidatus Dactylopiibacterium carminicum]PAS93587.1 MAG: flagellar biosynthesis protein FlgD [Candidatus Dactylopiibacterium carminicum]PAS97420.1 MAG: flagellar biosynthesis protein FlgD [Candidatus Dactylopiibacterium carminicum]PAS99636.1 MAG: hypothetical protein BSR46_06595 [Candidatus Dactylopiibacterium carminicum]
MAVTTNTSTDIYSSINSSRTTTKASAADEVQTRFLTLLTAQLKNQDPLSPMESAEMTSQLAQISTVEGVTNLNTTLTSLVDRLQSNDSLQASALIGHAVLVPGDQVQVYEGMGVGGFELASGADQVTITITDSNGLEVQRMDYEALDAGTHEFVWDGKNAAGTTVADGTYKMTITAYSNGDKVKASTLELATVGSVVTGGSEVLVDVGRLGRVSLNDIKLIL